MCSEFFNGLFQSFGNFDAQNASIPKTLRRDPDSSNKTRKNTIRTMQLILDGVLLNVEGGVRLVFAIYDAFLAAPSPRLYTLKKLLLSVHKSK